MTADAPGGESTAAADAELPQSRWLPNQASAPERVEEPPRQVEEPPRLEEPPRQVEESLRLEEPPRQVEEPPRLKETLRPTSPLEAKWAPVAPRPQAPPQKELADQPEAAEPPDVVEWPESVEWPEAEEEERPEVADQPESAVADNADSSPWVPRKAPRPWSTGDRGVTAPTAENELSEPGPSPWLQAAAGAVVAADIVSASNPNGSVEPVLDGEGRWLRFADTPVEADPTVAGESAATTELAVAMARPKIRRAKPRLFSRRKALTRRRVAIVALATLLLCGIALGAVAAFGSSGSKPRVQAAALSPANVATTPAKPPQHKRRHRPRRIHHKVATHRQTPTTAAQSHTAAVAEQPAATSSPRVDAAPAPATRTPTAALTPSSTATSESGRSGGASSPTKSTKGTGTTSGAG